MHLRKIIFKYRVMVPSQSGCCGYRAADTHGEGGYQVPKKWWEQNIKQELSTFYVGIQNSMGEVKQQLIIIYSSSTKTNGYLHCLNQWWCRPCHRHCCCHLSSIPATVILLLPISPQCTADCSVACFDVAVFIFAVHHCCYPLSIMYIFPCLSSIDIILFHLPCSIIWLLLLSPKQLLVESW